MGLASKKYSATPHEREYRENGTIRENLLTHAHIKTHTEFTANQHDYKKFHTRMLHIKCTMSHSIWLEYRYIQLGATSNWMACKNWYN